MNALAFSASYSDWKLIKTRSVVQIVFEVPLEAADAAYDVLGGMPTPAKETWFGIAPIRDVAPNAQSNEAPTPAKERRSFDELLPAQQAGIWCNEPAFWKFLEDKYPVAWSKFTYDDPREVGAAETVAAGVVRHLCGVNSRASIKPDNRHWQSLVSEYRMWQRT